MASRGAIPARAVLLPCAIAALLCLRGLPETVAHPDQMAFLSLFKPDKAPFNPGWFEKPPFHTYFHFFLSEGPVSLLGLPPDVAERWRTLWSKLLQVMLFAGSVAVLHAILRRVARGTVALAIATLFATSAGMVAHAHFLTADVAVTFWMLLAFLFCQRLFERGRWQDYAAAGLLTGIAAATKYNGIGVGIAIPVAHAARWLLQQPRPSPARAAISPQLILGLALVGVGFVAANPFALLDFQTFFADFVYNSKVAPVYEGQTGHSYGRFFAALGETIGPPLALIAGAAGVWSCMRSRSPRNPRTATVWMAVTVLALYYAKFAPFPRLENRFVLPIAPYLLVLATPAIDELARRARVAAWVGFAGLLIYNLACSYIVGGRFLADPRVTAAAALQSGIPRNASVEADIYSAGLFPSDFCCVTPMPFLTGRERLFNRLFAGDESVTGPPEAQVREERLLPWFTGEALAARQPYYIVTNSNFYGRFQGAGDRARLYPEVRAYFSQLLSGRLGYTVIVDQRALSAPCWAYPQNIDFLDNRLVVLKSDAMPMGTPVRSAAHASRNQSPSATSR